MTFIYAKDATTQEMQSTAAPATVIVTIEETTMKDMTTADVTPAVTTAEITTPIPIPERKFQIRICHIILKSNCSPAKFIFVRLAGALTCFFGVSNHFKMFFHCACNNSDHTFMDKYGTP